MQVLSGRVVHGVVILDDDLALPEGSRVSVVTQAREPGQLTFEWEEAEIAEMVREMEEATMEAVEEMIRRLE